MRCASIACERMSEMNNTSADLVEAKGGEKGSQETGREQVKHVGGNTKRDKEGEILNYIGKGSHQRRVKMRRQIERGKQSAVEVAVLAAVSVTVVAIAQQWQYYRSRSSSSGSSNGRKEGRGEPVNIDDGDGSGNGKIVEEEEGLECSRVRNSGPSRIFI